jgi:hypothetical protein
MEISDRFREIIFKKLNSDLSECVFFPSGRETWIVNTDDKYWYFLSNCDGEVHYNSEFFNRFFRLFSLKQEEYQEVLKQWFEFITSQKIRIISRRGGNFDYILEVLFKKHQDEWTIFERYGWSYHIVKKYTDMKKNLNKKYITVSDFI